MSQKILDDAIKMMFKKHFIKRENNFLNPAKRKSFEKQTKILYGILNQMYDDIGLESEKIEEKDEE